MTSFELFTGVNVRFIGIILLVLVALTIASQTDDSHMAVSIIFQWWAMLACVGILVLGIIVRMLECPRRRYRQVACCFAVAAGLAALVAFLPGLFKGSIQWLFTVMTLMIAISSFIAAFCVMDSRLGRNAFYAVSSFTAVIAVMMIVVSMQIPVKEPKKEQREYWESRVSVSEHGYYFVQGEALTI